jgi:hypothetical protein
MYECRSAETSTVVPATVPAGQGAIRLRIRSITPGVILFSAGVQTDVFSGNSVMAIYTPLGAETAINTNVPIGGGTPFFQLICREGGSGTNQFLDLIHCSMTQITFKGDYQAQVIS